MSTYKEALEQVLTWEARALELQEQRETERVECSVCEGKGSLGGEYGGLDGRRLECDQCLGEGYEYI